MGGLLAEGVERDEEAPRVAREYLLSAVAVVDVEVDDRDPGPAERGRGLARRDRDGVEEAEALARRDVRLAVARDVVARGAHEADRAGRVAGADAAHGVEAHGRRAPRRREAPGAADGVSRGRQVHDLARRGAYDGGLEALVVAARVRAEERAREVPVADGLARGPVRGDGAAPRREALRALPRGDRALRPLLALRADEVPLHGLRVEDEQRRRRARVVGAVDVLGAIDMLSTLFFGSVLRRVISLFVFGRSGWKRRITLWVRRPRVETQISVAHLDSGKVLEGNLP